MVSAIERLQQQIQDYGDKLPPVHQWQPLVDAEMDLEIRRDGSWVHEGGVIERIELVKLLASVLRREDDNRYALVTPAERVFIRVQQCPFLIVDWNLHTSAENQQVLALVTNLDEQLLVCEQRPLWLEGSDPAPRVDVRAGLPACFSRAAYYRLADVLEQRDAGWGIESGGFFNRL